MRPAFLLPFLFLSFAFSDLLKPDSATLRTIHVLFEWEQEPDAVEYNIQASNSISFNNLYINTNTESVVYIEKNAFDWGNNVYWRVRPVYDGGSMGDWIDTRYFSIGNSILGNLNVDIYDDGLIEDGLVMYSQFAPYVASGVIDKYGNEIWNTQSYVNHINEFGQVYGMHFETEGGDQFNYDQDIIWTTPIGTPIDAHEIKQLPNGNYMAFTLDVFRSGPIPEGPWTTYFQDLGYAADGVTNEFPWLGLRLVEWDQETKEEVWTWDPFDYFTMDDYDLYGGVWWGAYFNGYFDWLHSNAFHFDGEEEVIYVSHRHLSRITKIDYQTGEVVWNMGLPAEYNTGDNNICTDLRFSFQHNIQLLDDGSLLFFDNGNLSEMLLGDSNPTTRIRRIRVIDNSYCETIWEYELPPNLFGSAAGSVQLLDNGNYSIYTIASGSVIEVTPEQEIIWKHTGNISNSWGWYYRAYKIPSIHPDAFSVIADNYTADENNNNIIQISGNSLDFTVINKSGYTQPYQFSFGESTDGPPMFDYEEGDFTLGPNESIELSFEVLDGNISSTNINFSIWPVHHDYSLKELSYNITTNDTLLGDLNGDGTINVVDIVMLVNIILNGEEYNPVADLNSDGTINVVDIVTLVNIILN